LEDKILANLAKPKSYEDTLATASNAVDLTVAIVSASQAKKSRSRLAALYAQECLTADNIKVDLLDLKNHSILTYAHSEDDPQLNKLVERFNAADAWVLAVPVYNWGPSGVLTFCITPWRMIRNAGFDLLLCWPVQAV
jgi:FMN-dependent NADH-azoreductase